MVDQKVNYETVIVEFVNGDQMCVSAKDVRRMSVWGKHEFIECKDGEINVQSVCGDFILVLNKDFKAVVYNQDHKVDDIAGQKRLEELDICSIIIQGEGFDVPLLVPYSSDDECQRVLFDNDNIVIRCTLPNDIE